MSPRSGSKPDAREDAWLDAQNRRASRRPKRKRRPTGERKRPHRDRRSPWRRQGDRSAALIRFGQRHGAGILGWLGIAGLLVGMWAFTGTAQLVTVGASLAAAGGGAAIRHHQQARTVNSDATRRPTRAEVRAHHDAMRTGRAAKPDDQGADSVTVRSHTNDGAPVRTHTRRKPGVA